jgi:penicillin-binding protein 2
MSFGSLIQDEQQIRHQKSYLLIGVVTFFFLILVLRLIYIQIIQAELNIRLSKENAMRLKVIVPPRGKIFDRNGEVLARNRPSYSICLLPYKLRNREQVVNSLCMIRDTQGSQVFDSTELESYINQARSRRFDVTRLKEDVSLDLVSVVEEHSMELPGVLVETESRREYTLGKSVFHVVGYMGEIPEEEFSDFREKGYHYGDLIGKSGIEREFERVFRGKCGQEYIEVNAYGKSLGPIPNIPRLDPESGNDVYLTIDSRLQKVADLVFPDTLKGAVVALDPRNGEVLLMFSSPSVDPNIFSMATSLRSKNWLSIATDPNLPLNNRAISGTYTPGSTFKLITSVAGVESGLIEPESYMPTGCKGAYRIGSRVAHCWKLSGHGSLNMIGAVQHSCNIYFYQAGLKLGDANINEYARMFGLGSITGIELAGERSGWLSGEEEYNRRFARRGWKWTRGLVLDMAIGQTQVVTPLQLALMAGGLGNSEFLYKPFLVKEERDWNGNVIARQSPEIKSRLELKQKTRDMVHEALAAVVRPGGTGTRAAVPGITVGGKTGSAENPHGDLTHALFIACAPVKNPVISIAVVVENAGHGGSVAAPIAGDVLRYFFAETEEGKKVMSSLGVDSTAIKKLNEMVEPIRKQMALYEQGSQ